MLINRTLLLDDFYNLNYLVQSCLSMDIFVGMSFLYRVDSNDLLSSLLYFFKKFRLPLQNFHVISTKMGRIISCEFGLQLFDRS